jgi:hypothetical protein
MRFSNALTYEALTRYNLRRYAYCVLYDLSA